MRSILLLLLLVSGLNVQAADYRFRHLTSQDGLPHQQVETMAQDQKGYIWIGTRNGLARYDGYDMKCYYHEEDNPHSLSDNFVKRVFVDSRQRLWVSTEWGICRYRPATDDFRCYYANTEHVQSIVEMQSGRIVCGGDHLTVYDEQRDSFLVHPLLESGFIVSLAVDADDRLYVASNTSICSYNPTLTQISRLDASLYADFTTGIDGIMPMLFDSQGRFWIGRNGQGVQCVSADRQQVRRYGPEEIADGIVRAIAEDGDHRIWLGTEKGITVIHPDGRIDIIRQQFQNTYLLSDNAVYCILCDRNDNVWIGSYFGGVDVLFAGNAQFSWMEPGYGQQNIRGKVVRMMTETTPGQLWIATEDMGISIYDRQSGLFHSFTQIPQMGTNVHSLYYDPATTDMWIGTFRSGLFRYNLRTGRYKQYLLSSGLPSDAIFYILRQASGRLWVATTQGLRYYEPETDTFLGTGDVTLDTRFVYALCADRDDNLWAGTAATGLFRIDAKSGHVEQWSKQGDERHRLPENYVTCIYQDHRGDLYIGTNNNGLLVMRSASGLVEPVGQGHQLRQLTVCSINEDKQGTLWIGTSRGLYLYRPETQALMSFTTENGLPTNQFNFQSSLLSDDGRLYMGMVNGMIAFDPQQVNDTHRRYEVHLKSLSVNHRPVTAATPDSPLTTELDSTASVTLSYEQAHSFSIDYGIIAPGASNVNYQLFVEGLDRQWRDAAGERRFYGYNLQPGTYRLHVRANAASDGWEQCPERVLTIVVQPPFYRSLWAYLLYALLAVALAYVAWRIFDERMRSRGEVRLAKLEKAKLEEIDRSKFDFFTTVSHELKTPLSLIVAPLRTIARQELTDDNRKNLDMALKNTQKMESLISELVTFNKIETDRFPFYVQRGNPLTFILLGCQSFREASAGKHIAFSVDTEDNGEEVWFSPDYVERILNNLLSNALKFTPDGGSISVAASIVAGGTGMQDGLDGANDQLTYLRLSVADTGIGIAREEQENIFNRYYQTKRGHNMNNSGWGIGLSLVKRLCEVHKGSVMLDSEIGRGSTFTCLLCVDQHAFPPESLIRSDKEIVPVSQYKFVRGYEGAEVRGNEDSSTDGTDVDNTDLVPSYLRTPVPSKQDTLLIVEDNADLQDYLCQYFAKDYHVLRAANGREALAIVGQQETDLVVSDVMMPEMDGITLCQTLKESMQTSHIPVILLTAKSDTADVVAGYKSGAEAYVSKPFDPEVLELQIKNIMQLQKTRQTEVQQATDEADIEATSLNELDKTFIRQINELVDHNIANSDFAVGDITQALFISRSLLHTKMKTLVGLSMGDFIRKKRLDRACQMLREGHNVSETAYATGFSDPNYFSKTFKKHIGVNPSEMKKD